MWNKIHEFVIMGVKRSHGYFLYPPGADYRTVAKLCTLRQFPNSNTFLEIEWYFGNYDMLRVANVVDWMNIWPLN